MPIDTAAQQPAILRLSIRSFRNAGIACDVFAGHSLGSYSAMVAAGALEADDAERIVTVRGQAMADAGREQAGGMIALLGCSIDSARGLAEQFGLTVANDNAPGQIVLSGAVAAVDAIEQAEPTASDDSGTERRVRLKRLPVSGAFHSPLIESAAVRLADEIATTEFGDASTVIANGSAQPYADPGRELVSELLSPVRFRESLLYMWDRGVREFVEFEPAGVLTGLVKRTLPEAKAFKVSDLVAASESP
jgi:malonyl CoA-acyl carrier protein transacylase